jgi:hypothetical protein
VSEARATDVLILLLAATTTNATTNTIEYAGTTTIAQIYSEAHGAEGCEGRWREQTAAWDGKYAAGRGGRSNVAAGVVTFLCLASLATTSLCSLGHAPRALTQTHTHVRRAETATKPR